jgi:hypothetical protein
VSEKHTPTNDGAGCNLLSEARTKYHVYPMWADGPGGATTVDSWPEVEVEIASLQRLGYGVTGKTYGKAKTPTPVCQIRISKVTATEWAVPLKAAIAAATSGEGAG